MNILPTGPDNEHDPNYDRYFADLRRWNFDIAYNAFYAFPLRDVQEKYADSYQTFARRAREEKVPSCVQIQSVVAHTDDIPLSETQRYADNSYYLYEHVAGAGRVYHFASFASHRWLEFLKSLTALFRSFGFEWIVFEEPMLHTDIPGPDDPIREVFMQRFPGLPFPMRQDESGGYLALQKLKRDLLVEFYAELAREAKRVGFSKVGIMPWFFTPTFENTPAETWNTCCDTGRLTFLPDLDFIVVRMQPDNIYAQVMIAATGESTPTLSYYECLAHALGKPIIMVNNPTDEHRPEANRASALIPYAYFQRYTLAAAAACPQGMSRHWYGKNYDEDSRHMNLMARVNPLLRRLSPPSCEVAFVYSHAGASHVYARPWRETWRSYWNFAHEMVEKAHWPFLTFFAESLEQCLAAHPEVRVLVLNEFFPIPEHEIALLETWLEEKPGRHVVYFGGHDGHSWLDSHLFHEYRLLPPEMTRLCGVDTSKPVEIVSLDPMAEICFLEKDTADAVLGKTTKVGASAFCRPVFDDHAGVDILYETDEAGVPLLTRRPFGNGSTAWFVGVSLEGRQLTFPFGTFFERVVKSSKSAAPKSAWPQVRVASATQNVFFNTTRTGFFIVANCSSVAGELKFGKSQELWDVCEEKLVEKTRKVELAGCSLRLFRLVKQGTRILDVQNAIYLMEISETRAQSTLRGMFHMNVVLVSQSRPSKILADQAQAVDFESERCGEVWKSSLRGLPQDDISIQVFWS